VKVESNDTPDDHRLTRARRPHGQGNAAIIHEFKPGEWRPAA